MNDGYVSYFKKMIQIFLMPICTAYFLHHHIVVSIAAFPVRDVMVGMIAAFAFMFLLQHQRNDLDLKFNPVALAATLVFLGIFFALFRLWDLKAYHMIFDWNIRTPPTWGLLFSPQNLTLLVLSFAALASSFFCFQKPSEFVRKLFSNRAEFLFFFILVVCQLVGFLINRYGWQYFSAPVTFVSRWVMTLLGYEMIYYDNFNLTHKLYNVKIGALCSGLEGITFFILIYTAILMFEWRKYTPLRIVLTYLAGILYMFFLNVFRIVFLFVGMLKEVEANGRDSPELVRFIDLFHSHLGWTLYLFGIVLFFGVLAWLDGRKKPEKSAS